MEINGAPLLHGGKVFGLQLLHGHGLTNTCYIIFICSRTAIWITCNCGSSTCSYINVSNNVIQVFWVYMFLL